MKQITEKSWFNKLSASCIAGLLADLADVYWRTRLLRHLLADLLRNLLASLPWHVDALLLGNLEIFSSVMTQLFLRILVSHDSVRALVAGELLRKHEKTPKHT